MACEARVTYRFVSKTSSLSLSFLLNLAQFGSVLAQGSITLRARFSKALAAAVHHPELVPILALGMFAGLRPCEADIFDIAALTSKTTEFAFTRQVLICTQW